MRLYLMFVTAVWVLYLIKLRWPKKKNIFYFLLIMIPVSFQPDFLQDTTLLKVELFRSKNWLLKPTSYGLNWRVEKQKIKYEQMTDQSNLFLAIRFTPILSHGHLTRQMVFIKLCIWLMFFNSFLIAWAKA